MSETPPPNDVPSPCTGICRTDGKGICVGCYRSLNEIAAWGALVPGQKLEVLQRIRDRKALDTTSGKD